MMEGGPINSYTEDDFKTPLVSRGNTPLRCSYYAPLAI
jgi:hypothetical protein